MRNQENEAIINNWLGKLDLMTEEQVIEKNNQISAVNRQRRCFLLNSVFLALT